MRRFLALIARAGPLDDTRLNTHTLLGHALLSDFIQQGEHHGVPTQTSVHTLRHTFARNYLAQYPGDVVGLATLLEHTSLDTTRIYSQPTIEQLSTRIEHLPQNAYGE